MPLWRRIIRPLYRRWWWVSSWIRGRGGRGRGEGGRLTGEWAHAQDKNRQADLTEEKLEENAQNAIALCRACVDAIVESEPYFPQYARLSFPPFARSVAHPSPGA